MIGRLSQVQLDQTFSVLKQIMREPVPFGAPWKKVSAPARDLVEKMLQKDPKKVRKQISLFVLGDTMQYNKVFHRMDPRSGSSIN